MTSWTIFFVGGAEWWRGVCVFYVLCFCSIDGFNMRVRLVLGISWVRVVETLESGGDVGEHGEGEVYLSVFIVPV